MLQKLQLTENFVSNGVWLYRIVWDVDFVSLSAFQIPTSTQFECSYALTALYRQINERHTALLVGAYCA